MLTKIQSVYDSFRLPLSLYLEEKSPTIITNSMTVTFPHLQYLQ